MYGNCLLQFFDGFPRLPLLRPTLSQRSIAAFGGASTETTPEEGGSISKSQMNLHRECLAQPTHTPAIPDYSFDNGKFA
jgi:hypothetical protein